MGFFGFGVFLVVVVLVVVVAFSWWKAHTHLSWEIRSLEMLTDLSICGIGQKSH